MRQNESDEIKQGMVIYFEINHLKSRNIILNLENFPPLFSFSSSQDMLHANQMKLACIYVHIMIISIHQHSALKIR
jgi:hypothetical protein